MVALLSLLAITSATVAYDRYGNAADLTVIASGRRYVVPVDLGDPGPNMPKEGIRFGATDIKAEGTRLLQADGKLIVDAMSCSQTVFPHTPDHYENAIALRSKGGLVLDDRAIWIFSWDAVDTMSEPSGDTFAIELLKDGNTAKLGRIAPIKGLGSHIYFRGVVPLGKQIAMIADGISFFEPLLWQETKAMTGGEACVAGGNRIYWNANGNVSKYDPETAKFVVKARPDLGYLAQCFTFGTQDVLVFQHGLLNPEIRSQYYFPGGGSEPNGFYPVGNLAIGFLGAFPPSEPGILLSPDYLAPLAMIKRRR